MPSTLKITRTHEGRIVHLQFDHGKANEMGSDQLRELAALTQELHEGPAVALVTTSRRTSSRGTPIFVAGANVTERTGWDDQRVKEHVRWQRSVLAGLKAAPVFHIAVVGGVALGWGTEYMLVCDYRIATPRAVFALPETGLGILPGAGGTSDLWAHIGVAQTLRLGMTNERISAEQALQMGLVQETAEDLDSGLARAVALAERVAKASPTAVAAFKRGVLSSIGRPAEVRTAIEDRAYSHCVDTGQAALGRQHFAQIRAGEPVPWGALQAQQEDPDAAS